LAITYHAGRRIQGTSTDAAPIQGGWKELARTTLGSTNSTLDSGTFTAKKYYQVLVNIIDTAAYENRVRFNADSGSNYAFRYSQDGGTDGTAVNDTNMLIGKGGGTTPSFANMYIANLSSKEKLMQSHQIYQGSAGAGNAPERWEGVNKWANTANDLTQVQLINASGGSYNTGSEIVVLGWDPTDTHTSNFWEELASVDLSGGAANSLSTGTFTAKKYLWIQYFAKSVTDMASARITFNSDTGSNYARRQQVNGGSDGTGTNLSNIDLWNDDMVTGTTGFLNLFMINNSATEKLGIGHSNQQLGSGAGTAPQRREAVIKWANTSNQITNITLTNHRSGQLDTPTTLKVWGSN